MAKKIATDSANAAILMAYSDDEVKDKLKDKWNGKSNKDEHYNDSRLVEFSSLDTKGWLTHDFYTKIRKQEAKQHKRIICIDMGTKYTPIKLGDKVQVSGLEGDYIVIQKKTVSFEEYADRCQYLKLEQRNKIIDEIKTLLKDHDSVDEAIKDLEEQQNILEEEQKKVKEDIKKAQDVVKERVEDLEEKANDWNDEVKRAATPWIRVAMPMNSGRGSLHF